MATASVQLDLFGIRELANKIDAAAQKKLYVGIQDHKNPDGISAAEYGVYYEYGWVQKVTPKQRKWFIAQELPVREGGTLYNPPRPFFRQTFKERSPDWAALVRDSLAAHPERMAELIVKCLEAVGQDAQQALRAALASGGTEHSKFPRRSALTMAMYHARALGHKKDGTGTLSNDKPGVVSQVLMDSIAYEIR